MGLIQGTPSYETLSNVEQPTEEVRVALYSPNGQYFAFTQPNAVTIVNPDDGNTLKKLELKDVFDLAFSPNGSYLSTWEKPVKGEDGNFQNNVKIWDIKNATVIGTYCAKDQSGWKPDFTADEKVIARIFKNEVRFFEVTDSVNFSKIWSTLKLDGVSNFKLSPGKNATIATFVPEQKGKPANVSVWTISAHIKQPVSSKTFFKAERCTLKWNALGTALLALASTDVDSSNKSYYGETTLYLLGIAGSFDSRITLDKEGPIHDITWSPSAREFGVVYGYMPAQTTFFDSRGNSIHSLPPAPKNTILFSPHARYVLVAGFGNLQGTVDVYDRLAKFTKVSSFEAPNTSVCQWSPDGRFILTATTSPRLRVDNGVKIWYATGKLVFTKDFKEVYSVDWRPRPLELFPPLKALDDNPAPHQSAIDYVLSHPKSGSSGVAAKPKGAYRPPHARNGNASTSSAPQTLYQKEIMSAYKPPAQRGPRVVPGMAPPVVQESKSAAKNRKKRENKKASAEGTPEPASQKTEQPQQKDELIAGGVQSLEEKKIRSLLKKLRAIEQLKMRQAGNEPLEETQILKIQTEGKVRSELAALGWSE